MTFTYQAAEPEIQETVKEFLDSHPGIKDGIKEKLYRCLQVYLFNNKVCNKEPLTGSLKGFYSLRVGFGFVCIYCIEGKKEKRAQVLKIMTENNYHKWMNNY